MSTIKLLSPFEFNKIYESRRQMTNKEIYLRDFKRLEQLKKIKCGCGQFGTYGDQCGVCQEIKKLTTRMQALISRYSENEHRDYTY